MHLRALKIRGFKSFARKTIFEFEPGVTIIVGPNGSGKSNVADAVMWVLGEQSPTSLRGSRMEDIIFSGSASLKPVNIAEVVLTLDNSNNAFPLDYSEITISRNVVRGGDSEYRLNNTVCRLLDIQELLSDAGVGRTLNSVVSQGQLDEVLSCRAEERRDYIEEAGGLLKYRRRREKAMRRMERTEEELVRTKDILREVRRLLRPLQRQAGRLEQYQELTRELSEARLALDVTNLRMLQKEWNRHQEVQSEREERVGALEAELSEKARLAGELEEGEVLWRAREAELRDRLYRLVSVHEQLKAMYSVRGGDRHKRDRSPAAIRGGLRLADIEAGNRDMEKHGEGLEERVGEMRSLESELADKAARLKNRLYEITRESAALEARLEVLSGPNEVVGAAGERRRSERKNDLGRLEADLETLEPTLALLEEAEGRRIEGVSSLEGELENIEKNKEDLRDRRVDLEREEARLVATLELLWRLDSMVWGVANSATALLNEDPTGGRLEGMLAESIEIEPPHETAVMSYLGPWAYGLAVKDAHSIKAAIGYLKEKGMGQALFFRTGAGAQVGGQPVPNRPTGGARSAREVVSAPRVFSDALDALLSDAYLAGDLDQAFVLAERYPNLVFLSPDGDVISGGTLIKGGSPAVSAANLELTRRRREELEDSLGDCRSSLEQTMLDLRALTAASHEASAGLDKARSDLDENRAELFRQSALLASCRARAESIRGELEHLAGARSAGARDEVDLEELEARLRGLKEAGSSAASELQETEVRCREVEGEARSVERELAAISRQLEIGRDAEHNLRLAAREHGDDADEGSGAFPAELLVRLEELHRGLIRLVERKREGVRKEMDEGAAFDREAAVRLRKLREEVADLQGKHDVLRDRIHGDDLSRAELKVRVEQLVERIVDGHQVPLEFALKHHPEGLSAPDLERKVEELSGELEHIGPVNPEAIVEMKALEQRHDFLTGQLEDVKKARSELRKVVRKVDREIERQFKKTIDEVNRHFKEIFTFLFPNGRAELRLTDPDHFLSTGVEIMAQPEGKRLRHISLLSGGETSLTAIAFFFSLFKVRPSPFYFLDEVEAALDDVNLHRFLELVREFKSESQLILITHQKRSMEIADLLYGVTMQDDGMSRVVSQRAAS